MCKQYTADAFTLEESQHRIKLHFWRGHRHHWRWIKYQIWEENSETRPSHVRSGTRKPAVMCSHSGKSSQDSKVVRESCSEREEFFLSIKNCATSLNCELIKLLDEKKLLYQDPETEHHARLLLEEQKDYLLSGSPI